MIAGSIRVSNIGKAYKKYKNQRARLIEWLVPFSGLRHNVQWILSDINFSINPGESYGIIGINGAGKSTLLKMITGTVQPTTGTINLCGKVAALLELGMGFHPDFTGRQNAYMAGQLIGLSHAEIDALMPKIEDFAEIGDYIDQPVRVYSSGMQVRLAFSVATAKRPDILIVDEALSVGDAYFQHKSFERIRQLRNEGTTLLMVSHDRQAIQSICDQAILLSGGKLAMSGSPEAVMDYYNAMLAEREGQIVTQKVLSDGKIQTTSGNGAACVEEIFLKNARGEIVESICVGQDVILSVKVRVNEDLDKLVLGYGIKDRLGQVMYGTNTNLKGQELNNVKANASYLFNIKFNANLGPGTYSVQTALVSSETHLTDNYEWKDLALIFSIYSEQLDFTGCNWLDPQIAIEMV